MRLHRWALALACIGLTAGLSSAEEIIQFTNGTFLAVRSHEVQNGMVHVDLGDDGKIAFPEYMVDEIRGAGANVTLPPSNGKSKSAAKRPNRTASSKKGDANDGYGKDDGLAAGAPNVEIDEKTGVAVYKPFKHSKQAGKRQLGSSGNQRVFGARAASRGGEGHFRGSRRVGNRNIIGGNDPRGRKGSDRTKPVGLEMKTGVAPGSTRSGDGGSKGSRDGGGDD